MTSSAGISHPGLGAFPPPALQTFTQAVTSNVAIARTRTRSRIMAVVKADGYGHGAITVAQAAIAAGAEWLGTTDIAEASKLRAAGLTVPILTWLNPSGVDAEAAATDQIDVAVGSVDELEALLKHAASRVRVHLNMDTGMAREGCFMREWDTLIARARQGQQQGKIRVVGLMGQLPLADQAEPEANTPAVSRMRQARRAVMAAGFDAPLTHLAATSGTLTDPATHFGMVRLGAGLVGIDPSETTELHGASRLTAPVVHSATVKAGTPVGYGGTYVASRSTSLSVLPVGYADGIPREISPDASVEIRGRRYRWWMAFGRCHRQVRAVEATFADGSTMAGQLRQGRFLIGGELKGLRELHLYSAVGRVLETIPVHGPLRDVVPLFDGPAQGPFTVQASAEMKVSVEGRVEPTE